ncbi:NADPH-dependent oxidoreductase [Sinirhodobacter populi]|uniref:NADPH-dependent oxidoreductase n=2 Tax=Paenirhodobacter populi TaxID=2306993 RepID=A0A443JLM2_9RHOB|nr:NADPH-dependent oxidoreductase [Sinirhodobacter populi]
MPAANLCPAMGSRHSHAVSPRRRIHPQQPRTLPALQRNPDMTTQTSHDALDRRYGGLQPAIDLPLTPTIELMLRHRSVRSYQDRPLAPGALEALIAAGQSAATSSNMQAVSVIAVQDAERRGRLSRAASGQAFVAQAPVVLCFVIDQSRPARIGRAIGADLFALPMLDSFIAGISDCAIFAQTVALAAESMGLGTCFVGNLRNDPEFIAQELNLPPQAFVVFGLCIGYERPPETGIRPRLPQSVVLHHETYSDAGEAEDLARYDAVFSAHETAQGRPAATWTGRHRDRFASTVYLAGRDRLRRILAQLSFPLQ